MTAGNSIVVNYDNKSAQVSDKGDLVKLVQDDPPASSETVTAHDIQQMVTRAAYGMSAWTYKPDTCWAKIVGETVVVTYRFFAWPYPEDLDFTVTSDIGELSSPMIKEFDSEVSLRFERSMIAEDELPISFIHNVWWETNQYNSAGEEIVVGLPTLRHPASLEVDVACFGVCRLRCRRKGAHYTLTVILEKTEDVDNAGDRSKEGLSITGLEPVITARWGMDGVAQLKLKTPKCVQELLESCDWDGGGGGGGGGGSLTNICPGEDRPVTIYVSSCSDEVLKVVHTDELSDNNSWCG